MDLLKVVVVVVEEDIEELLILLLQCGQQEVPELAPSELEDTEGAAAAGKWIHLHLQDFADADYSSASLELLGAALLMMMVLTALIVLVEETDEEEGKGVASAYFVAVALLVDQVELYRLGLSQALN